MEVSFVLVSIVISVVGICESGVSTVMGVSVWLESWWSSMLGIGALFLPVFVKVVFVIAFISESRVCSEASSASL